MKNLLLLTILLLFQTHDPMAQTVAMDFTQSDCHGNQRHLFSELDAGHVIVLEFIMLNCAPCITATKFLETLLTPYETSHPGRVGFYSFGFLDTYTCDQLNAWVINNKFNHPIFSHGEEQVNYYGGMGMPTIVVVGTNEHKVFYNSIGYTPSQDPLILAAINSALLYNPTGIGEQDVNSILSVYPTVFSDWLEVRLEQEFPSSRFFLVDVFGRKVLETRLESATSAVSMATTGLSAGMYIGYLETPSGISGGLRLIKR